MYITCEVNDSEIKSIKNYDMYFLEEEVENSIENYGYSISSYFGSSISYNIIIDTKRIEKIQNITILMYLDKIKNSDFYRQILRKEKLNRLTNVSEKSK